MAIVECNHVSIRYMIGDFKDIGLKEFVVRKLKRNYHVVEFWADKDVTFSLEKGDMLGIIGSNGAGKSTLLKAVTGIMEPTEGYVVRRGNCAALLELASGFDGDLTVKENAFLRGAMLGYTRDFMNQKYDDIIKFAELEDFQDRPFKQLSSGMKSRLAFSIASLLAPEILILDEVLSVGDGAFRAKSEAKMREIIANGATTILVSHILSQVRSMCNKVLWLEKGHQIAFGDTKVLCSLYQMFLDKRITLDEAKESLKNLEDHYDYLIVGTGFSGAVFAHEAAKRGKKCLVVDRRRKIGGLALEWNKAGVTYQWNGRHVFHTDNEETWNYVNQFAAFRPYRHKVYAKYGDNYYPVSVDMEEVKNGCKEVMKEEAAKICERADKTECDFFSDKFQGVPEKGYTELFAELLKDCKVISGMEYKDVIHAYPDIADKIIYTGGIDAFFGYEDGRLEYRTMTFKEEVINDPTYLSKAEVINCEPGSTNNKIVEFKLITGEESEKTLVVREFPAEFVPGKECYFPVHSDYSNEIYEAYVERAKKEAPNVRFLGRLGTFRYLTMAEAVEEARKAAAELMD